MFRSFNFINKQITFIDRIYGLKSFPEKYDKTGKLVRKYCPELSDYPDKVSDHILGFYIK